MTTSVGPLEVGEIKAVTFDFAGEAATGAVLNTPEATCVLIEGTDPTPANVLSGAPNIVGLTVTQLVKPGVVGCKYKLRMTVQDTSGQRHGISAYMRVVNG